jgi:mono/diheme cytochrome c family protein
MIFALSTGHKIGLAGTGAAFIIFSLISALVVSKRDPDFPGRHIRLYLTICVCFFLAMMAAVLVFGREEKSTAEAAPPPASTTPTTTTPTTTTPSTGATGDAAAGAVVFKSAGCVACHTLKAAGSTGTVGPNLDQKKPSEALIRNRVENGKGAMPPFKSSLSQKQIDDVVAYVYTSTHA